MNDGTGNGSANSLYPMQTPTSGEVFTQQNEVDAEIVAADAAEEAAEQAWLRERQLLAG
jgi:hypothetical protein